MNNMQNHQVGMQGQQIGQTDIQKNWCLISDECKNTMNYQGYSQAQLLKIYIKKRAYALIVTVVGLNGGTDMNKISVADVTKQKANIT